MQANDYNDYEYKDANGDTRTTSSNKGFFDVALQNIFHDARGEIGVPGDVNTFYDAVGDQVSSHQVSSHELYHDAIGDVIEDSGERPAIVNGFIVPLQKPFYPPKIYQMPAKARSQMNTPSRDRLMQTPNNNITLRKVCVRVWMFLSKPFWAKQTYLSIKRKHC